MDAAKVVPRDGVVGALHNGLKVGVSRGLAEARVRDVEFVEVCHDQRDVPTLWILWSAPFVGRTFLKSRSRFVLILV